jgi:two-component system cell cycle response regulator DivK
MVGDEIEARKAGCDDYLSKPIDDDLLIKKIKKFLD